MWQTATPFLLKLFIENNMLKKHTLSTALSLLALSLLTTQGNAQTIYHTVDKNGTPMLSNTNNNGRVFYQSTQRTSVPTYDTTSTTYGTNTLPKAVRQYTPPSVLALNVASNHLENANARTLGRLLNKYKNGQPITVAHFGDSHIQTGWQIQPIRKALQEVRGNGGRGMIFPYKMAKTYSQEDYNSHFTGSWRTANSIQQPPKIGVGISGFVGVTKDSYATFGFDFKDNSDNLGNITATMYVRATGNYEIRASNGAVFDTKTISANSGTQLISFNLPNTTKSLDFTITRLSGTGEFELHGVNLGNNDVQGGVVYHNLGVGGAAYKALMQQQHFNEQFSTLNADLVILDWGTNDILYTNSIPNEMESVIRSTISKVRAINPHAAIILSSVQESRYKGNPTTAAQGYAGLVRHIAQSEGVIFYDWYSISGGQGSMRRFQDNGYANPKDSIHLNAKGYRVKGELFATALINALESN